MTKITQADREAAAAFYGTWGATKGWQHLEEPIRKGLVDDNALVQAFARHRIAAEQRGKLEGARLALEAAAKVAAWAHMVPPDGGSPSEAEKDVADNAAAAIRALDPAKIVGEG